MDTNKMVTGVHVHAKVMEVAWTSSFWDTFGVVTKIRMTRHGRGHGHGVKPVSTQF